jgi:hypothetical protein
MDFFAARTPRGFAATRTGNFLARLAALDFDCDGNRRVIFGIIGVY